MGLSRSAKYYRDNPDARKKKNAYQKLFNKKKSEIKRRSELNALNRLFETYGNGDKKDVSHRSGKKPRLESQSKNRGSKTNTPGDKRARGKKK
jgi:hypothetical protein